MERPARTQGGVVMGFLIHSGTLVCMDQAGTVARGDLLVRDGKIAALGPAVGDALCALPPAERPDSFDATGALVVPGLIQGHLHLCQTLFRGMAEQPNLLRWLTERIWPLEAAHTEASLAASARLGLLELVASGVSCVHDMGTVRHTETIGVVLEQTGVRAIFGKALMDQGVGVPAALIETPAACLAEARALARRFQGAAGGRLAVSLAPRFVLAASTRLWEAVAAESQTSRLLVHTHLAESMSETRAVASAVSTTAARYLAQRGLMTERLVAAHGVWLDLEELMLVEGARASLVHCPGSNLKLGSGIAALGDWLRLDLKRGLGSDGAACNNRLDLFHEMGLPAGRALGGGMIVGPCLVVTGGDEPRVIENGAVRVVGAHIAQMGEAGTLASSYPDETVWPARGRVLLPGLVNTHAHLARHLARGLDLATRGAWDRYDRALTPDAVHASVMAALVEGVRHGVTTVCDFHRSGGCLDLSLVEVAGAALKVGVRLATCYGATDDDPEDERRASLEESLGLAADLKRRREGRLRGTVGVRAHALSTIERLLEESLAAAGGLAVHVDLDLDVTVAERWNGTLPRGHTPTLWAHAERAPRRLAGLAAER